MLDVVAYNSIGFFVDGRLIHEQRIATALRSHSFSPAVSLARDQQLILRLSNLKYYLFFFNLREEERKCEKENEDI